MSILVAGIGNVLRGDDGFGVEVVRRLQARGRRDGVDFIEFGIRGFDLAYALSSGTEKAILVDAASRGGAPGTIYVLAPHEMTMPTDIDPHGMHPLQSLALAKALGGIPKTLRVVACEPESFGDDVIPTASLTPSVEAAVDRAMTVVDELLSELRDA